MDVATVINAKGFTTDNSSGKIGFIAGAGSTATQTTDRSTGVTLNAPTGKIQTDTTSLAAEASAEFQVTNSFCEINDVVVASIRSGSNGGNTAVTVTTIAAGSFKLRVSNNNASGGTAETGAILINFVILKGASA